MSTRLHKAASAFAGLSSVPTEAAYSSTVQCEDVRFFSEAILSDTERHALQKAWPSLTRGGYEAKDEVKRGLRAAMAVVFGRKGQSKLKAGSRPSRPSEDDGIGRGRASIEHVPKLPIQSACSGRPKIFLEIAIFRGAFFGVDHQQALEFELYPEAAPKAARRLLEDCAAGRLSDRRLTQITPTSALLDGAELGEPETETGKGLPHTDPGMLSVSRNVDFAGYILTLAPAPRLDRDHAAVGRLITGSAFLDHIVSARDSTCKEVRVVNCGEVLRDLPSSAKTGGQSRSRHSASRSRSPRCSWFPSIGGECLCLMAIRFSDTLNRFGELPDTGDPEEDLEDDVHELTVGTLRPQNPCVKALRRTATFLSLSKFGQDILGEALLGEGFALRLSEKSEQQGLQQWIESNSAASPSRGQRVFGPVRLRTRATSWDVTREGGDRTVTVVITWCTGEAECSECPVLDPALSTPGLAQFRIFVLSQACICQEDERSLAETMVFKGSLGVEDLCPMAAPSAAAAAGAAAAALLQQGTGGSEQGWSEHQTGDGRKFFHNEETGVSQWEKPDSLMTDSERIVNSTAWKQYRIWDGRIFYHNKETKVSCWSMPPELRKLRGESTGLDDRPLPETRAEQRQAFQEFLKERQVDATWDWRRVQELARARAKARNAAVALERLVEERFADPDALGTTYEEAARILGDEEAWTLIKSDVRRDEVFQTVMERLEEKHEKHRADKRAERVVRLQRLMATDPELRRPRMRWKDATAVLARRDELQEEEPPIEALRVWASMRELRQPATREVDPKNKAQADFFRDERKRRDAFVLSMKELAAAERFTMGTSWAQLEEMLQASGDQRIAGLREGEGAVAMELFDEFVEELKLKGAEAYAGVEPAPPPPEPIVVALWVQACGLQTCTSAMGNMMGAGKPEDEHQRAASANPRCERSTELLLAAPKVELHVHLDGSFDAAVLFRAAQAHLEELPEKVRTPWDGKMLEVQKAVRECHGDLAKFTSLVTVGSDIIGLFPILDCFYTFLPIVRGRFELLEELAFEFCRERKKHNIIYTEVRYSPFEFLPQGEDGQIADTSKAADAVKAVCAGLRKGQAEFGVMVHQILCCIAAQPAWSAQTMVLAEEFRNEGVVGVDIAAGEMHFEDGALHDAHRDAMAMAQKKGLGITVHAAEAGPGDNVCRAMDVYGATRIGHGYRSVGMEAYNYARSKGVHFELCPTSSVSTQAIELEKADGSLQWKSHPISRFFLDGTSCSINSDDPAVFRSSLTDELVICVKEMGLSLENIQWMTLEALEHAFHLESGVKDTIAEKVKAFYEQTLN
ncbi:ADA [Symbiodinium sp. KB8]|nr:ADA [Symbiodinium sp. KB8]